MAADDRHGGGRRPTGRSAKSIQPPKVFVVVVVVVAVVPRVVQNLLDSMNPHGHDYLAVQCDDRRSLKVVALVSTIPHLQKASGETLMVSTINDRFTKVFFESLVSHKSAPSRQMMPQRKSLAAT
jgi:hypothetical protein